MSTSIETLTLFGQKVEVKNFGDGGFAARLAACPGIWDAGRSREAAIGNLVITWNSHLDMPDTPQPCAQAVAEEREACAEGLRDRAVLLRCQAREAEARGDHAFAGLRYLRAEEADDCAAAIRAR